MTKIELYERVIKEIGVEKIHPLHEAMLEECCENIIKADTDNNFDDKTLITSVQLSFIECDKILRETFKATLESLNGDIINLNYRDQNFKISKDSPFLK
jgi:hypothetical protein